MIQTFVARTRDLLNRREPPVSEKEPSDSELADSELADPEPTVTTTVYSCQGCDRTFVSEEKETCSQCGAAVEAVPNEYDLGIY